MSVLLRGDTLLPKEDADAAAVIAAQLQRDGIRFLFNTTVSRVETSEDGGEGKEGKADEGASSVATLHLAHSECPDRSESEHSPSSSLEVDAILVATGACGPAQPGVPRSLTSVPCRPHAESQRPRP